MRLTFEGPSLGAIFEDMNNVLIHHDHRLKPKPVELRSSPEKLSKASPAPVAEVIPEVIPSPKKRLSPEHKAKMMAGRIAKSAMRAANAKPVPEPEPVDKPVQKSVEERAQEIIDKPKPVLAPAELVALRTKTIAELQKAYAGGKHQEVMELLSRFGNGAKSFRELQADAFVPIREAIELGALT